MGGGSGRREGTDALRQVRRQLPGREGKGSRFLIFFLYFACPPLIAMQISSDLVRERVSLVP